MILKRFILTALLLALALAFTVNGLYNACVVQAYQDTKTGTTTGFPTGSICKKSGTYRASNKYLENIIVVAEGEVFPPFSDGTKTIWYPRSSSTRDQ
jgi:hypothetical protein